MKNLLVSHSILRFFASLRMTPKKRNLCPCRVYIQANFQRVRIEKLDHTPKRSILALTCHWGKYALRITEIVSATARKYRYYVFDGEYIVEWPEWMVYNIGNTGLPDDDVRSLTVDSYGNVWIGTYEGLAKFDGEKWTVYNTGNSGLPSNRVTAHGKNNQGDLVASGVYFCVITTDQGERAVCKGTVLR